jgi:hypothetical protein
VAVCLDCLQHSGFQLNGGKGCWGTECQLYGLDPLGGTLRPPSDATITTRCRSGCHGSDTTEGRSPVLGLLADRLLDGPAGERVIFHAALALDPKGAPCRGYLRLADDASEDAWWH